MYMLINATISITSDLEDTALFTAMWITFERSQRIQVGVCFMFSRKHVVYCRCDLIMPFEFPGPGHLWFAVLRRPVPLGIMRHAKCFRSNVIFIANSSSLFRDGFFSLVNVISIKYTESCTHSISLRLKPNPV